MNAKVADRTVGSGGRTNLGEVAPLEAPFVLMIDPSSACNLRCTFCPTGYTKLIQSTGRFHGYMNVELFEKIINDLEEFGGNIKTLRLYKEGDPLVNPHFPELIKISKKSKKIGRIDTTTNGLLLTRDLSERIINSGIDQINISINGVTSEQYERLTKVSVDFKKLVSEIKYLHSISGACEIYVKGIEENLSVNERKIFYETFSEISDRIFLEHLQPNWPNFKFKDDHIDYSVGLYGQPLLDRDVCPYIFYIMVINSDGTVSACVQDWSHELIVGDVRNESVRHVWHASKLKELQILHLKKKRCDNRICAVCPVLRHGSLDNLDADADKVLAKLI